MRQTKRALSRLNPKGSEEESEAVRPSEVIAPPLRMTRSAGIETVTMYNCGVANQTYNCSVANQKTRVNLLPKNSHFLAREQVFSAASQMAALSTDPVDVKLLN